MASYRTARKSLLTTTWTVWCESTPMHGWAYLVQPRHWAEIAFWAVIIACFGCCSIYIMDEFVKEHPLETITNDYNYDPDLTLLPTVTICPNQGLDELNLLTILLNRLNFKCQGHDEGNLACNHSSGSIITHPKWQRFLSQVPKLFNRDKIKNLGGEIDFVQIGIQDWVSFSDKISPLTQSLLLNLVRSFIKDRIVPMNFGTEMPPDEHPYSVSLFPRIVNRFREMDIPSQFNKRWSHIENDTEGLAITTPIFGQIDSEISTLGVERDLSKKVRLFQSPAFAGLCPNGLCSYYDTVVYLMKKFHFIASINSYGAGGLLRYPISNMEPDQAIRDDLVDFLSEELDKAVLETVVFYDQLGHSSVLQSPLFGNLSQAPETDLKSIMEIMRYSMVLGNARVEDTEQFANIFQPYLGESLLDNVMDKSSYKLVEESQLYDFSSMLSIMGGLDDSIKSKLSSMLAFDSLPKRKAYQVGLFLDRLESIPFCQLSVGHEGNCRALFHHVATSEGVCSAFNSQPIEAVLRPSAWLSTFQSVYSTKKGRKKPFTINGAVLTLLLDVHNSYLLPAAGERRGRGRGRGAFRIGIANAVDFGAVYARHLLLEAGLQMIVTAAPLVKDVEDEASAYPRRTRQCLLRTEVDRRSMFRVYSQRTCFFECMLEIRQREMGCRPWDLLPAGTDDLPLCSGSQSSLLRERLSTQNESLLCPHCLDDCTTTTYSLKVDSFANDAVAACLNEDYFNAVQNEEASIDFANKLSFKKNYIQGDTLQKNYCLMKMSKDLAIVTLKTRREVIQVMLKKKATLLETVAVLAGAIGLFNGLSIVVPVELAFWLFFLPVALWRKWQLFNSQRNRMNMAKPSTLKKDVLAASLKYCSCTTIHGFIYVSALGIAMTKVFWVVLMLIFLFISGFLSFEIFIGYNQDPFELTKPLYKYPLTDVPFPTVTICAQQFPDRWNFPRLVLNQLEHELLQETEHETAFEQFKMGFALHDWVATEVLATSTSPELTRTMQLLMENEESVEQLLYKLIWNRNEVKEEPTEVQYPDRLEECPVPWKPFNNHAACYFTKADYRRLPLHAMQYEYACPKEGAIEADIQTLEEQNFVQTHFGSREVLTSYSNEYYWSYYWFHGPPQSNGIPDDFWADQGHVLACLTVRVRSDPRNTTLGEKELPEEANSMRIPPREGNFDLIFMLCDAQGKESANPVKYRAACVRGTLSDSLCPHGFTKNQSLCYLFIEEELSFSEARTRCLDLGADLLMPETVDDIQAMVDTVISLSAIGAYWLGIVTGPPRQMRPYHYVDGRIMDSEDINIELLRPSVPCWLAAFHEGKYYMRSCYGRDDVTNDFLCRKDLHKNVIYQDSMSHKSWNIDSCRANPDCLKFLKLAQQVSSQEADLTGLGSLLQHFSETVIGRLFHPSTLNRENYLAYETMSQLEQGVVRMLSNATRALKLFDGRNIPLHEIAPLTVPLLRIQGGRILTDRELTSLYTHIIPFKELQKRFRELDEPFLVAAQEEVVKQLRMIAGQASEDYTHLLLTIANIADDRYDDQVAHTFFSNEALLPQLDEMYANNVFGQALTPHLFHLMKVMRFSVTLANAAVSEAEFSAMFHGLRTLSGEADSKFKAELLWADSSRAKKDLPTRLAYDVARLDTVLDCQKQRGASVSDSCEQEFSHTLTNLGICSAYNALAPKEVYVKGIPYLDMFSQIFRVSEVTRSSLQKITGSGSQHSLHLILDNHYSEIFGTETGHFQLSLESQLDAVDSTADAIRISPGQKVAVAVAVHKLVSSGEVRAFTLGHPRECRFPEERASNSFLEHYSQKSCQFECGLKRSLDTVGCVPWNYPHPWPDLELCLRSQVAAFESNLTSVTLQDSECGQCPEDCESVKYQIKTDSMMLDPYRECRHKDIVEVTLRSIQHYTDFYAWQYRLQSKWREETSGPDAIRRHTTSFDRCLAKLTTDISYVDVVIQESNVELLEQVTKHTLATLLGVIGGNLGLFTGFSFVSSIELIYWFYVLIEVLFKRISKLMKGVITVLLGVLIVSIFSAWLAYYFGRKPTNLAHPSVTLWSSWDSWSECSQTCNTGFKSRQRQSQTSQGKSRTETISCNFWDCNKISDGVWSPWVYSRCSASCGQGMRQQSRECLGLFNGGLPCVGDDHKPPEECQERPECPDKIYCDRGLVIASTTPYFVNKLPNAYENPQDCDQACQNTASCDVYLWTGPAHVNETDQKWIAENGKRCFLYDMRGHNYLEQVMTTNAPRLPHTVMGPMACLLEGGSSHWSRWFEADSSCNKVCQGQRLNWVDKKRVCIAPSSDPDPECYPGYKLGNRTWTQPEEGHMKEKCQDLAPCPVPKRDNVLKWN